LSFVCVAAVFTSLSRVGVFVIAVDDDVPAALVDAARSLLHWFTLALIDIRCCSFDEDLASGEFVQSLSGDFGISRVFTIVDECPIFFSLPEDDGIPASTFSASDAFPLNVTASSPNFARKSLASSRYARSFAEKERDSEKA
jgi:hypothetical protein